MCSTQGHSLLVSSVQNNIGIHTIININSGDFYTIQAKKKNDDASYQSDLSLLCLHLPPVEEGRAARHHYGVGLLLVLAEAPHTLEVLQEILY